jgi:hypothetical protein
MARLLLSSVGFMERLLRGRLAGMHRGLIGNSWALPLFLFRCFVPAQSSQIQLRIERGAPCSLELAASVEEPRAIGIGVVLLSSRPWVRRPSIGPSLTLRVPAWRYAERGRRLQGRFESRTVIFV